MATIFFGGGFEGLCLVDYLPAEIVFKLCDAIKQKRRGTCRRVFGFFTTMHPVHKSLVAQQAVCDCGFCQINHPAYSPDLAPSDYKSVHKSEISSSWDPDNELLKAVVKVWF